MREYNDFPETTKEKIIDQRNRQEQLQEKAEKAELYNTMGYHAGWVAALNWIME